MKGRRTDQRDRARESDQPAACKRALFAVSKMARSARESQGTDSCPEKKERSREQDRAGQVALAQKVHARDYSM